MPLIETYERTVERTFLLDPVPLPTCTPADPFGIDHDCRNPTGHDFIAACGDVVCCHCSKVVWS
jgi:hypothetical protein